MATPTQQKSEQGSEQPSGSGAGGAGGLEVLAKQFRPSEHEGRVWERWVGAGVFHADPARVLGGAGKAYTVLIPPPNVTDRLHLGHAFNNTIQDVLTRAHRMMGFEALWMPGTDHAGIATQAVVEKRLRASGELKGALKEAFTRDAFVEKIQAFKDEYEAVITGQLKRMGCSCDWERQRFTMDPQCAEAVREAFFRLFRDGLIYRGKRLVNWDPVLQTAVADDECFDEEIDGNFYYLRYPLVHPHGASTQREREAGTLPPRDAVPVTWSELRARGWDAPEDAAHADEHQAWVTVATTRPETYLGDTAVAINPHDPRAKALKGLCVELPLVGRVIPIVEDGYVVLPEGLARTDEEKADPKAKFATGFLKVTPAHDANDHELYQRHKRVMDEFAGGAGRALINIFAPDATVSDRHGWSDVGGAHVFVGLAREEARRKVVGEFKTRTVGGEAGAAALFAKSVPYRHSVPHSDRSKAVVEPYLSDQWYVRVTDAKLAGAANRALVEEQRASATQARGAGVPPASTQSTAFSSSASSSSASSPLPRFTDKVLSIRERRLPHWELGGSTYFLTFRLAHGQLTGAERDMVMSACKHWDGDRLELHAAVVMPDHVHLIFSPFEKAPGQWHTLTEILHSIKSFTSHEINKSRGTQGSVWQDESYDRIIRHEGEFAETLRYVLSNPVNAGLTAGWRDYAWTFAPAETLVGSTRFAARWRGVASGQFTRGVEAGGTPAPQGGVGNAVGNAVGKTEEAGDGSLRFHPGRYAKSYEQWHDGIRDWCISRQLWWGHRIPVWSAKRSAEHSLGFLKRVEELEKAGRVHSSLKAPELGQVSTQTVPDVLHSVCVRSETDSEAISLLEANGFVRDPDVLDTWFSSALWPLSTLGWPRATPELAAFNPTSTLCTAREIITLWVSRMVMFNRYFMPKGGVAGDGSRVEAQGLGHGPAPFRDVFIHAVIQDGQGQKMSKSLGNGVDPLDIILSHGADAMRFTLCHMATQTQDVRMPVDLVCPHTGEVFAPKFVTNKDGYVVPASIQTSPKDPGKKMVTGYGVASGEVKASAEMPLAKNTSSKFDMGRNFATKLWNAAKFAMMILENAEKAGGKAVGLVEAGGTPAPQELVEAGRLSLVDRWMLSRLARGISEADAALREYQFSAYAQGVYDLLWRDFCDWYLEAIKPTVEKDAGQRAVLRAAIDTMLRLLHPVMPFVTEVLFEAVARHPRPEIAGLTLGAPRTGGLLASAGWPRAEGSLIDERSEREFEAMRTLVTAIREVRAQHTVPFKRKITLHVPAGAPDLGEGRGLAVTLAGLEAITGAAAAGASVAFSVDGLEYRLSNLKDAAEAVDTGAEKARLTKVVADLTKSVETLDKRLSNPGYADKAPPHMVQQSKEQLEKARRELAAAQSELAALG